MVLDPSISATFVDVINVQSEDTNMPRTVTGVPTYGAVRRVYGRVEQETERANAGRGEETRTRHRIIVGEEILPTDRLWILDDADDDESPAPVAGKHRKPLSIGSGRDPDGDISHWEVVV